MEIFNYRENIWLIKLAQIIKPKYQFSQDINGKVVKAFFVGTGEELSEILTTMSK